MEDVVPSHHITVRMLVQIKPWMMMSPQKHIWRKNGKAKGKGVGECLSTGWWENNAFEMENVFIHASST
jgi:hypothetical protein